MSLVLSGGVSICNALSLPGGRANTSSCAGLEIKPLVLVLQPAEYFVVFMWEQRFSNLFFHFVSSLCVSAVLSS